MHIMHDIVRFCSRNANYLCILCIISSLRTRVPVYRCRLFVVNGSARGLLHRITMLHVAMLHVAMRRISIYLSASLSVSPGSTLGADPDPHLTGCARMRSEGYRRCGGINIEGSVEKRRERHEMPLRESEGMTGRPKRQNHRRTHENARRTHGEHQPR